MTNVRSMLALLLIAAGCHTMPVEKTRYKINLPSDVSRSVEYYVSKTGNEKKKFISVSWIGFFDGEAIYVSSSRSKPTRFSSYPVAWSNVDSTLVLVYDSRYSNYLCDSTSLMQEVDVQLDKAKLLKPDNTLVEDNLSLRFIRVRDTQKIDTSYLNIRVCDQLSKYKHK